jgi:hypothetical protein
MYETVEMVEPQQIKEEENEDSKDIKQKPAGIITIYDSLTIQYLLDLSLSFYGLTTFIYFATHLVLEWTANPVNDIQINQSESGVPLPSPPLPSPYLIN